MTTWLAMTGSAALVAALYVALLVAPGALGEGPAQRIRYLHAPAAFASYACIFVVAGASAVYLWKRSPGADRLAVAAAEVGVLMCTIVLATGTIWGRARWGAWWTPDPRLTLTLILWAIYEICNNRCSVSLPIESSWMKLRGQLIHKQKRK